MILIYNFISITPLAKFRSGGNTKGLNKSNFPHIGLELRLIIDQSGKSNKQAFTNDVISEPNTDRLTQEEYLKMIIDLIVFLREYENFENNGFSINFIYGG